MVTLLTRLLTLQTVNNQGRHDSRMADEDGSVNGISQARGQVYESQDHGATNVAKHQMNWTSRSLLVMQIRKGSVWPPKCTIPLKLKTKQLTCSASVLSGHHTTKDIAKPFLSHVKTVRR